VASSRPLDCPRRLLRPGPSRRRRYESNTTPSTCPIPEPPFATSHNTCSPFLTPSSLPRPFPAPLGRHLELARPRLVVVLHCQDSACRDQAVLVGQCKHQHALLYGTYGDCIKVLNDTLADLIHLRTNLASVKMERDNALVQVANLTKANQAKDLVFLRSSSPRKLAGAWLRRRKSRTTRP